MEAAGGEGRPACPLCRRPRGPAHGLGSAAARVPRRRGEPPEAPFAGDLPPDFETEMPDDLEVKHCYRHPMRETGVSCSNCGRPICHECMIPAPVGFRCPECVREQRAPGSRARVVTRAQTRSRWSAGGIAGSGGLSATKVLVIINVVMFVVELVTGATAMMGGGSSQALVNLGAGVAGGEDFDRQVGRAWKKGFGAGIESELDKPVFENEGDIGSATVAVAHPKPHAGAENSAEAAGAVKGFQGKINTLANLLVLEIVFGAHNQLAVDPLVNVTVIGQCLKFGLCPRFPVIFDHRTHG